MYKNNVVAIDFGTSRTKLAYFDPETKKVEIMNHRVGKSLPSYFAVSENEEILVGYDAQKMFESKDRKDRRRAKSNIKGRIHGDPKSKNPELGIAFRISGKNVTKTPQELLTALFTHLKKEAGKLPAFKDEPQRAYLTHPVCFSDDEKEILMNAAQAAGFSVGEKELLTEAEAAAKFVGMMEEDLPDDIIILDCGAGTLHWASMHLEVTHRGKAYIIDEVPSSIKPGGTISGTTDGITEKHIGGRYVEFGLARRLYETHNLQRQLGTIQKDYIEFLCYEARLRKEQFCRSPEDKLPPIEIDDNFSVQLTTSEIKSAIENDYIAPACKEVEPYIKNVINEKGKKPVLVLTGGCAQIFNLIKDFKTALEERLELDCIIINDFEYATVRGALLLSDEVRSKVSDKSEFESKPSELQEVETAIKKMFDGAGNKIGNTIANNVMPYLIWRLLDKSCSTWKELNIGGDEDTYLYDWVCQMNFYLGVDEIQATIASYFVKNLPAFIFQDLDGEVSDFFKELETNDFFRSLDREVLSKVMLSPTQVQRTCTGVVKKTVRSILDGILTEINIQKQLESVVKYRQTGRVVGAVTLPPLALGSKKWRIQGRRNHLKSRIQKKLKKALISTKDAQKTHIRKEILKVFGTAAEKLCQRIHDDVITPQA